MRFQWGLATEYADGSFTQFAGTNYNAGALDVAAYSAYQSPLLHVTGIVNLSPEEFATVRATSANLESLYQATLGEGFQYMSTARITYHDGTVVVNAALRTADRQFGRILSLNRDGQVLASSVSGAGVGAQDMNGGLRANLDTQTYEFWGVWQPDGLQRSTDACDADRCFRNCMLKAKAWGAVDAQSRRCACLGDPTGGRSLDDVRGLRRNHHLSAVQGGVPAQRSLHALLYAGRDPLVAHRPQAAVRPVQLRHGGNLEGGADRIDKCSFGQRCVAGGGRTGRLQSVRRKCLCQAVHAGQRTTGGCGCNLRDQRRPTLQRPDRAPRQRPQRHLRAGR